MANPQKLLDRLDAIGRSVEKSDHAEALFGLGSVGQDGKRLDEFSDLDFFLIVQPGFKQQYISDLSWLSSILPLTFQFQNTVDGWKVLFEDGIFAEFAVFEQKELVKIPFSPGRIIWKKKGVADSIAMPDKISSIPDPCTIDWHLGEALSNLYIGMCRYQRGEKLSAFRFVQHYAVDRILALHEIKAGKNKSGRDPFSIERRLEHRHPELCLWLIRFVPGYEKTPAAALAILDYLSAEYPVNAAMEKEIRQLCDGAKTGWKPHL